MKSKRIFSLLAGSLTAILLIATKAHSATAESEWGDTSYSKPADPEIIPMTASEKQNEEEKVDPVIKKAEDNDQIEATMSSAELSSADIKGDSAPAKELTDISTVQNTYGVETEERKGISFYAAPFGGASSMLGNNTSSSSAEYAAGATIGLLLSQYFLVDATFTHVDTGFSSPIGVAPPATVISGGNVYDFSQNVFSAGGRFFILGRESRIRPFIGGGLGYSRGSLDYSSGYAAALAGQSAYLNDLNVNEFLGYGEVGAEIAITRALVATLGFQINGVLSSSVAGGDASSYDSSRVTVANSIGQTASYLVVGGLGFYF